MPVWLQPDSTLKPTAAFKMPVTYPDALLISGMTSKIDGNQFLQKPLCAARTYSDKLGLIASEAEARMVYFNFEKSKRLTLDDDLIAILHEHLLG